MPPIREIIIPEQINDNDNEVTELPEQVQDIQIQEQYSAEPDSAEYFLEQDKNDLYYAKFAKDVYNDTRNNIDDYEFQKEHSTDRYGTYINPKEVVMAIKGTSSQGGLEDYRLNSGLLLGSLGGSAMFTKPIYDIQQKINELKKIHPEKKFRVSGHSLGGSLASFIGVDNPDIDVTSFNRGEGVGFISSAIKCGLFGCQNVKNYRIVGDFASSLTNSFSTGRNIHLAPKIPDLEVQLEAKSAESFFIPSDLYIPHSINNFVNRTKENILPDSTLFGRTLARRVGAVTGIVTPVVLPPLATAVSNKLKSFTQKLPSVQEEAVSLFKPRLSSDERLIKETILETGGTTFRRTRSGREFGAPSELIGSSDIKSSGSKLKESIERKIKREVEKQFKPIENIASEVTNKIGGLNSFLTYGVTGGLGSIAGVGLYENFIAPSVNDISEF